MLFLGYDAYTRMQEGRTTMTIKRLKGSLLGIISIIAVLITISGIYYMKKIEATKAHNQAIIQETDTLIYTKTGRTKAIEKLITLFEEGKYLSLKERAEMSVRISRMYFIDSHYEEGLEYSIISLYLTDQLGDNFIKAKALMDMSNVFANLGGYIRAEEMIDYALGLEIKDVNQAEWVKKYGYLNLADIYSKTGKYNQSLVYISNAMNYYNKEDDYYKEETIIAKIIKARALFYKDEVDESKKIILEIEDQVESYKESFPIHITIPYLGIQSKIKIYEGDTKEGICIAEELFDLCDEQGLLDLKKVYMEYILQVLHTYHYAENIEVIKSYEHYLLQLQDQLIGSRNQGFISFILQTYDNKIKYLNTLTNRVNIFIGISCILIIITGVIVSLLFKLRQVKKQRDLDALTGVYNRGRFNKEYKKCIEEKCQFGLIMIDIDYFKNINDTYGHHFGDIVLKNIASMIKNRLTSHQKFFRYGGEEFCIICKEEKMDTIITLAERLRREVENMVWREGIKITISLGVAYTEQGGDLFKVADEELYKSKETGRNKVSY